MAFSGHPHNALVNLHSGLFDSSDASSLLALLLATSVPRPNTPSSQWPLLRRANFCLRPFVDNRIFNTVFTNFRFAALSANSDIFIIRSCSPRSPLAQLQPHSLCFLLLHLLHITANLQRTSRYTGYVEAQLVTTLAYDRL